MQIEFDVSSVQLSATITELIERLRQAAYDEGYDDARQLQGVGVSHDARAYECVD